MKNKNTPTEGQNSDKLEAESALYDAACCASSFRIIAEQDSKEFLAFPPPGMDRIAFTRGGAKRFINILTAWANREFDTIRRTGQSVSFQTRDSTRTTPPSSLPADPHSIRDQDSMLPTDGKALGNDGRDTPQSADQPLPSCNHDHQGLQSGIVCSDIPLGSSDGGLSSIIQHNV